MGNFCGIGRTPPMDSMNGGKIMRADSKNRLRTWNKSQGAPRKVPDSAKNQPEKKDDRFKDIDVKSSKRGAVERGHESAGSRMSLDEKRGGKQAGKGSPAREKMDTNHSVSTSNSTIQPKKAKKLESSAEYQSSKRGAVERGHESAGSRMSLDEKRGGKQAGKGSPAREKMDTNHSVSTSNSTIQPKKAKKLESSAEYQSSKRGAVERGHESAGSRMSPDEKRGGKQAGKGSPAQEKMDTNHSVPVGNSTIQPKKAKKQEPPADVLRRAQSLPSHGRAVKGSKEAEPAAEAGRAAEGGGKRGGGKRDRGTEVAMVTKEAIARKEAIATEPETKKDAEKMKVCETHERLAETQPEPANQRVPPLKAAEPVTLVARGGATVQEEEAEEEEDGEEDLYRAEEDIVRDKSKTAQADRLAVQDRAVVVQGGSSVEAMVNLLHYSEREWRGKTAKSALIRKGYEAASKDFVGLRRVRGDNYCALRATLYQVLSQSSQLPAWLTEEDVTQWPEQLLKDDLSGQWHFPMERGEERTPEGVIKQLKHFMGRLRTRWEAVARAGSSQERQAVCAEVFQGEEEEYGLLEVMKLLMLRTAVRLHALMQGDADVPVFCWLLFARDSSSCPRDLLVNHLRHVGSSGGLEQVEMFLLGYALQHTIKVYRLYKFDTEEFTTYYPDDHLKDWPSVCLVTEDDRHYNVPVSEADGLQVSEFCTRC
ncbi:hypothetical protein GJAV_G00092250 [Gymnothorax javanicus]|nr:hypothetical protein GJAV_G00092250 [Gymnothorax javanicus]